MATVVVLVGATAGSYAAVSAAFDAPRATPTPQETPVVALEDQPLVVGEPGSPVAVEPVQCPDSCFDATSILTLEMDEWDFDKHGFPVPISLDDADETAAVSAAIERFLGGAQAGANPDACLFAEPGAPISTFTDADRASSDLLVTLAKYSDDARHDEATQSVRLFPSTEAAASYLSELSWGVKSCAAAAAERAVVTSAPGLEVPDSLADVGWVATSEPGVGWRRYVFNIQAANAVVRFEYVTDGSVTEKRIRSSVQFYLTQLAYNLPRAGEGAVG